MWESASSEKQMILFPFWGCQSWTLFPGIRKIASYHKKYVCANVTKNQSTIHWSISANIALHSPMSDHVFHGDAIY